MSDEAILRVHCADRSGILAALTELVFRHGGNVLDLDQHSDTDGGRFFMRLVWTLDGFRLSREAFVAQLAPVADRFALDWELDFGRPADRIAVFCGKELHCLHDALLRQELGEWPGRIVLVVSNHDAARRAAEHAGIPFVLVPVPPGGRAEAEATQLALLDEYRVDLVVLARYMQILSADFIAHRPGRIINIHHSFLPAFAGARPYEQASRRGVKLIGATAHYATAELDAGPIIEQDVGRVTHRDGVADLVRVGRDLERRVLARAVRLHLQRRVLIDAGRTVVFG